jgi:hypothetical protein
MNNKTIKIKKINHPTKVKKKKLGANSTLIPNVVLRAGGP